MLALNSGHTIGNVGDPDLIGPDDGKLPLRAIWSNNGRSPGYAAWHFIAAHGFYSVQLHNTAHPIFTASFTDFIQITMNPAVNILTPTQGI